MADAPLTRWQRVGPVLAVLAVVLVLWYAAAVWLNAPQVIERVLAERAGWTLFDLAPLTWSMERPVLPAPHQIAIDLWQSVTGWPLDSPRNLLFHAYVTSSATLLGFVMGTLLGAVLAVLIVIRARSTAACSRGSSRRKRSRCWPSRRSSS